MKWLREESGVAMITAVLATLVVATLAGAGFSIATHNLDQSGGDRRRVQAIHAAEAGIDAYLLYLSSAPTGAVKCPGGTGTPTPPAATQTLPTSPTAQFTISVVFTRSLSDGTVVLDCGAAPNGSASKPGAATITAVGSVGSVKRTMQALYGLTANPGSLGGITAGVYSNGLTTFNGHAQLSGNPNDPNSSGDILSNGDLTLKGGGDDYGNVGVQACADGTCAGLLTLQGGTIIHQSANSKSTLSISNNSQIVGTARSSLAGITGGGAVGGTAYYCTGSAPGNAAATIHECNSTLPVVPAWSTVAFTYNPSNWTTAPYNYHINNYSGSGTTPCDNAYTFLTSPTGWAQTPGDYVLRITSSCTLSVKTNVTMYGNLALISDGSLSMNSQGAFSSASARTLYLMFNINTAPPCTSTTGISLNAQSSISNNVQEVFYTPCAISFGAGSGAFNVNGQVFAGSVSFGGGASVIASAIQIPGQDGVGFGLKMTYRREVIGS